MRNLSILLIVLLCSAASAQAAQVRVEPAQQEVSQGMNFTVDILADPEGSEVMGAEYKLYFDNTLLNATDQVQGTFLSGYSLVNDINNTLGRIMYGEMIISGTAATVPGVLASITFEVIGEEGVSELFLTDVLLSDSSAVEIPDVNVSSGSVEIVRGICGDVDGQNGVTIGDGIQVAMSAIYGTEEYPLTNPWAADVDCANGITIGDGIQIAMSVIYGTEEYPLGCC